MRYFSTFSGIGGFELGIQQAHGLLDSRPTREKKEKVSTIKNSPDIESKHTRESPTGDRGFLQSEETENLHPNSTNITGGQNGVTCVGFSEIDKYAIQIYQKHFPEHKPYGDITKIDTDTIPDFDLLVGGFPCQTFSIAGKRKGFDDTRGTMFFELARILKAKQPRLFVFENVKGLLSHDNGNTFRTIISTLTELGYDLQWQVLNSKNHGVPQNRERVFIIGHLRGTPRPEVFPFSGADEEDNDTRRLYEGDSRRISSSEKRQEEIEHTGNARDETERNSALHERGASTINQPNNPTHSNDRVYGADGISPTLEDPRIRRLTPTECERLQGFPDGWTEGVSDTQRYKTLGNAVTVNVIEDIMERLL